MTTGHSIELYEHQKLAVEQLSSGKILCAEVGTGKSRTALAYYFIKECGGSFPVNGVGEYKPMQKHKDLYVITTAKKRDSLDWEKEAVPFGIADAIKVDSWNNIQKYVNVFGAFFIFDEQRVSGRGPWVKAFLRIARNNHWILLSATPGDTWIDYVPVFMANGFYRTRSEFIDKHVVQAPYVKYFKVKEYINVDRLIMLKEMLLVNMDYIKPMEEHHEYIHCEYDKEKYNLIYKFRWNPYEDEPIKNISSTISLMRRVCNSDKSKIEELKTILKAYPKVIVFYNFDYELDILRKVAKEMNLTKGELNGHLHEEIPKTSSWIYLVNYMAGAEAWNCIETNCMVFYSESYSWKMMEQSAGRISRLNSPFSDLYYYHLVTDSGIDKAITKCLKKKKDFNENTYSKKYLVDNDNLF